MHWRNPELENLVPLHPCDQPVDNDPTDVLQKRGVVVVEDDAVA